MAIPTLSDLSTSVNPFLKECPPVDPVGQFNLPKRSISYTCIKPFIKSQSGRVVLHECKCRSPWCPECRWNTLGVYQDRLKAMDWRKVRQIVLTVDPEKFDSPSDAYEYVTGRKLIPNFLNNLKRTAGVQFKDWICSLEFHKDGFPHWHIMIEVFEAGKAGMIGQENIHRYWGLGGIREEFVRDERHWKKLTGYFGSKGYFCEGGKDHQLNLPEWALDYDKKIRRWNGKHGKNISSKQRKLVVGQKKRDMKAMRPYRVILSECGEKTVLELQFDFENIQGGSFRIIHAPVSEINFGFDHVKGEGWVRDMNLEELEMWIKGSDSLKHLWYDFEPMIFELGWNEELIL